LRSLLGSQVAQDFTQAMTSQPSFAEQREQAGLSSMLIGIAARRHSHQTQAESKTPANVSVFPLKIARRQTGKYEKHMPIMPEIIMVPIVTAEN
jgi:hypothetical protein